MRSSADESKAARLFLVLGAFLLTNALIAEFVGVKIFQLERTLGFEPVSLRLFTAEPFSFQLTAGVVLWPFVFVMTDIVNEYFGRRGVRLLSWIAAAMIAYAFAMVFLSIELVPAGWWVSNQQEKARGVADMQQAYAAVFGQGLWIIAGSITAFLVSQVVDVLVFQALKRRTGERWIWLRATGSTVVSQLIDSFVVLLIAFWIGQGWSLDLVASIAVVNYVYKFALALLMTPVVYLVHGLVERYLGGDLAAEMRAEALRA